MSGAVRSVLAVIDDLPHLVGARLGCGDWRTISQADVDGFAAITGDHQWIHVDPERAASGPFGGPIAHGFLTLSLCSAVIEETLLVGQTSMQVNYGLDRVRFPLPVPVDAEVRGTAELASVQPVDGGVQAVVRVAIEVRGAEKPACVADCVIRFYELSEQKESA